MARALSHRQATTCEMARTPRCRCRCRGRYHGAHRVPDVAQLPIDDPHSPNWDDPQTVLPGFEAVGR